MWGMRFLTAKSDNFLWEGFFQNGKMLFAILESKGA